MSNKQRVGNQIKSQRTARGWSQAELARRAGISRTAVSAIEGQRLVPSVTKALELADVLECAVEELFGKSGTTTPLPATWAWDPPGANWRFWQAEVAGRRLLFPVESSANSAQPHDGCADATPAISAVSRLDRSRLDRATLVVACCDPAAGMLATLFARLSGYRLLIVPRSSRQALDLLAQQKVHVAGIHLSTDSDDCNARLVRSQLGEDFTLLRVAVWEEGLALAAGQQVASIRTAINSPLRWIGREPGSGARQCQDQLLPPGKRVRRMARDHHGVAEAIRSGWADAGVCLRLTCEESRLNFFSLRYEHFELCVPNDSFCDRRIQALLRVIRSADYRRLLSDLPGYQHRETGETRCVT